MDYEREEIEIDLREIFHVLKKKILIIILSAVSSQPVPPCTAFSWQTPCMNPRPGFTY